MLNYPSAVSLPQLLEMLERVISGENPRIQQHSHQCEACYHVFQHSDMCAGSARAHYCPMCHRGPWYDRVEV